MIARPAVLTPASRLIVRCMDETARWSRPFALLASGAAFALVVALDYALGARFSLSFLYFLACILGVWCLGERLGLGVALLAAFAATAVRHVQLPLAMDHALGEAVESWNLLARILSFALISVVGHGLNCVLRLERWRASHDELTGLFNRAGFRRAMDERIAAARARGDNLMLAYMDLDGFKQVNDQHGHSAGDHVLSEFAAAAAAAVRPSDLFARLGGDEFAALLTLPAHVDGHRVAELLHLRLTGILAQGPFDVTCSMGAVFMGGDEAAVDHSIMEQADALMYDVKRTGKNAVRVARGHALNKVLRAAFPPLESDELDELLRRIDVAERRQRWHVRRAA